jgi:hypothetical protein
LVSIIFRVLLTDCDVRRQNLFRLTGFGSHSSSHAQLVPTFLTLSSVLDCYFAVAAFLTDELWVPGLLVSSPEESSAAEAGDTAVVNLVRLVAQLAADRTDVTGFFFPHFI